MIAGLSLVIICVTIYICTAMICKTIEKVAGIDKKKGGVEVVRCKDCKHRGAAFCIFGDDYISSTDGQFYCSYGEKDG